MNLSAQQIHQLIQSFEGHKAMVIGDIMVDSYIRGWVSRISPEAPVPIVAVQNREYRLGGAGNVALNLKALGAEPLLCGVTGQDEGGDTLVVLMQQHGLSTEGIIQSKRRITTRKTRIMAREQQMLRIDEEQTGFLPAEEEAQFIRECDRLLQVFQPDVLILQDYDKGVLTPAVIDFIIGQASRRNIPVAVDPKFRSFFAYRNVTLFKPNLKELCKALNRDIISTEPEKLQQTVAEIDKKISAQHYLVTLSAEGIYHWSQEGGTLFAPLHRANVADVSGAGDTVISISALSLATGADMSLAAQVANLAGGLVCEHPGVVPVNKEELLTLAKTLF